jgi:hypothetical protein
MSTAQEQKDKKAAPAPEERYFKVRFHAKSNPNDQDNVELSVNGETLVIQREQEVIIPERYVECARHATYLQFRQLPNQPRKVIGKVMIFPFDTLGEGSRADFLKQKREGTKKTKEHMEKYGMNDAPEV